MLGLGLRLWTLSLSLKLLTHLLAAAEYQHQRNIVGSL